MFSIVIFNLFILEKALLIIVWRRPIETLKLINALRKVAPKNIYIACDGPIIEDPLSVKQVNEVRDVIDNSIDWDCSVKKKYYEVNQGCKIGVSNAISWFFSLVDEGIILEDDCIPEEEFFEYCSILLERYRDDERIWCISGNNHQGGRLISKDSYFFGSYPQIWGWATWKRCWKHYDRDLKDWGIKANQEKLKNLFSSQRVWFYWKNRWDDIFYKGYPDTWDFQWDYTVLANSGMVCFPNTDLVQNIGFGPLAVHTKDSKFAPRNKYNKNIISPLKHPKYIIKSRNADQYLEKTRMFNLKIFLIFLIKKIKNKFLNI